MDLRVMSLEREVCTLKRKRGGNVGEKCGPIGASRCRAPLHPPPPPGGHGLRDRLQLSGSISIIVSRMYRMNPQSWMIYPHPLLNMRVPFPVLTLPLRCFSGDTLSCASKVRERNVVPGPITKHRRHGRPASAPAPVSPPRPNRPPPRRLDSRRAA